MPVQEVAAMRAVTDKEPEHLIQGPGVEQGVNRSAGRAARVADLSHRE